MIKTLTTVLLLFSILSIQAQTITQKHLNNQVTSQILLQEEIRQNSSSSNQRQYSANVKFTLNNQKEAEKYKGFITKEIVSTNISFKLNKSYKTYKPFNVQHKMKAGEQWTKVFYDTVPLNSIRLSISNVNLQYEYNQKASRDVIDNYYALERTFQTLRLQLNNLKFTDPDRVEGELQVFNKIKNQVNHIKACRFPLTLNLRNNDPINFLRRFPLFMLQYNQVKERCDKAVANWHVLYYEKGRKEFLDFKAIECYKKSIKKAEQNNIKYGAPYYQLAELEYKNGDMNECITHLDKAIVNNLSGTLYNECLHLYGEVYRYYIRRGDRLYGERAIEWYYFAKEVCDRKGVDIDCRDAIIKIRQKRTQVFQDIIDRMTFDALVEAQDYLALYRNEINSPEELTRAFQKLYHKEVNKAISLMENGKLQEAFIVLSQIKEKERKYDVIYTQKDYLYSTYQKLYNQSITTAQSRNESASFEVAIRLLKVSEKISNTITEVKYNIDELNEAFKTAYKGLYYQKLSVIKKDINQEVFDNVEASLGDVKTYYYDNQKWFSQEDEQAITDSYAYFYDARFQQQLNHTIKSIKAQRYNTSLEQAQALLLFREEHSIWLGEEYIGKLQSKLKAYIPTLTKSVTTIPSDKESAQRAIESYNTLKKICHNSLKISLKHIIKQLNKSIYTYNNLLISDIENVIALGTNKRYSETTLSQLSAMVRNIYTFDSKLDYIIPQDISSKLLQFQSFIADETCKNATEDFNSDLLSAKSDLDESNFIGAVKTLNHAIDIATENNRCGIDMADATSLKKKYYHLSVYQQGIISVEEMVNSNQFDIAVEKYVEMEEYYKKHKLNPFDIMHIPFEKHIRSHKNYRYQGHGLIYFVRHKKSNLLINELLRILCEKNQPDEFYLFIGREIGYLDMVSRKYKNQRKGLKQFNKIKLGSYKAFVKGYKKGFD